MQCPVCKLALQKAERFGVLVNCCTKCSGVWLDLYQLDLLLFRLQPHEWTKKPNLKESDPEVPCVETV